MALPSFGLNFGSFGETDERGKFSNKNSEKSVENIIFKVTPMI